MVTRKQYDKFRKKKPSDALSKFECNHFDELMSYETLSERDISKVDFSGAVKETIKDLDRLLK